MTRPCPEGQHGTTHSPVCHIASSDPEVALISLHCCRTMWILTRFSFEPSLTSCP